ncbi:hypothetical protein [Spartinivicinus poritis]|uniref:Uncharacterized protein n=1 Tax=Spartinivicinus poritis TaxID=2994640 RepID=A0ABT5UBF1_9GAMM|nr:hypothetical protein [Spartinivicinus sp. A2-2]MDE1462763.1 hypothetical protein [Spartinivicinus sp. A2-2]
MNSDDIIVRIEWSTFNEKKQKYLPEIYSKWYVFRGKDEQGCKGTSMIIIKEGKTRIHC